MGVITYPASATYMEKLQKIAVVGGISMRLDHEASYRRKLSIFIFSPSGSHHHHAEFDGCEMRLSATALIQTSDTTVDFFGGYTSNLLSQKRKDNLPSRIWGRISIEPDGRRTRVTVSDMKAGLFAMATVHQFSKNLVIPSGFSNRYLVISDGGVVYDSCDIQLCRITEQPVRHHQFVG